MYSVNQTGHGGDHHHGDGSHGGDRRHGDVFGEKPAESKVDLVCTAVREVLVKMGENHYLLSIITSYVRMSRPDLETVLSMIMKLRGCW